MRNIELTDKEIKDCKNGCATVHNHELQWHSENDGGSYWTCTAPNCYHTEFQYEDCPGGR